MDGIDLEVFEGVVGVEGVDFFLSLDCNEVCEELVLLLLVLDFVSGDAIGDVLDELSVESNLENLIESNESQGCQSVWLDCYRWFAIWNTSMSLSLNCLDLICSGSWKVVAKRIVIKNERGC